MYSHDTYGLGHLRRSLLLSAELTSLPASVLLTTGSPNAQSFTLPDGCDTVKLPALTKNGAGAYEPRTLGVTYEEILGIRSDLIVSTYNAYRPDVVIVDHSPVGAGGELRPLLERIATSDHPPQLVLGLREIIDDAARVREEWQRLDAWAALDEFYDEILVYGDPAILTTAEELGLPMLHPDKVHFTGYLTRPAPTRLPEREPTILVTVGGGGDGDRLLESYADFLRSPSNPGGFRSVVVTGPHLDPCFRLALADSMRHARSPVEVHSFIEDLGPLVHSVSGVIAMAGYNTVVELLSSPAHVLLAPRSHPRLEQTLRARRLADVAGFEVMDSNRPATPPIADFVRGCLSASHPRRTHPRLRVDGRAETRRHISRILRTAQVQQHAMAV